MTRGPAGSLRALQTPIACLLFVAAVACTLAAPIGSAADWKTVGQALAAGGGLYLLGSVLRRRWPSTLAVALVAAGLGCWRAAAVQEGAVEPWSDAPRTPIRVRATVDAPVETRGELAYVYVRVDAMQDPANLALPAGRLQLTVAALPALDLGDQIEIAGRVEAADRSTPIGRWLLGNGVVATARFPDVLPVGRADEGSIPIAMHRLRTTLRSVTDQMLPQPHASLVSGLLVGATTAMPDTFRLALIASGTSHIVVVSGYNITVVGAIIAGLFRSSRALTTLAPLVGVWAFTLLVGATPPAVRAAIMATVALLAMATGRRADALNALGLAAALMCFLDPTLVGNLSFQLSAISTLGLIVLQPRLAGLFPWLPGRLRDPVAATLAASLATLPLLTATFHQVSLASPLANVLVEPALPVITIAAAIGVPLAALVPTVAPLVGLLLALPAHAVVKTIEICASLPGGVVPVGEMPAPIILLYVLVLVAWAGASTPEGHDALALLRASPLAQRVAPAALASAAALIVAWSLAAGSPQPLVLDVLDVGHGDAILIHTPHGRTVLVDGGPNPSALLDQLGRHMGLFERNLSLVVLTQADPERLPGAVAALERYAPTLAIAPPEGSTSALYERWATGANRTLSIDAPASIELESDLTLELTPTPAVAGVGRGASPPRRALLLRLVYRDVGMLIAPALTAEISQQMAAAGVVLRADGLYVSRHGDAVALSPAFLKAVDPSVAVLSVGARNRDGLPARTTLDLLASVSIHRTDLHGTVELRSDGSHLTVVHERDPR